MQKIGAQYLVKRITDYVTAPAPPEDEEQPEREQHPVDVLDGQPIKDDNGKVLGTALLIENVAVYVVSDGYGDRVEDLQACLDDPESQIMIHSVNGTFAGIIYVPNPNRAPRRAGGMRASDV